MTKTLFKSIVCTRASDLAASIEQATNEEGWEYLKYTHVVETNDVGQTSRHVFTALMRREI